MITSDELLKDFACSDDPDAQVMHQLVAQGADLSKPHIAEFCFEADTAVKAEAIANKLDASGYEVLVYPPDVDNADYLVVAKKAMVIELKEMNEMTRGFEDLSEQYGTIFDGWGAEVVA